MINSVENQMEQVKRMEGVYFLIFYRIYICVFGWIKMEGKIWEVFGEMNKSLLDNIGIWRGGFER